MKETQESVPWGWWTAIGLPIAHLIIQVVLTVGAVSVMSMMLLATSRLNQDSFTTLGTSGVLVGTVGILGGLVSLALIYLVVTRLRKQPFQATIRLIVKGRIWPAAFGAVLLGGVMDALTLALQKPVVPDTLRPLFAGAAGAAAMTVFAVIVTPLVEELLFRGVLYPVAARSLGVVGGIVFTSVLFGLLHLVTYGLEAYLIVQTLVAGFYFTWLRSHTGSLVPSIAAHAAMNLYATVEAIAVMNLLK
jgi:membrane protease YdiL (CAAX protease family)